MIARVWKAFREKETGRDGGRGMSDYVHACVCVCAFATLNEEEQLLIVAGFYKGKHIC